jgi:hydroxymethylpyrimidine pyrophosphatase-like HAD family hydrolase
VLKLKYINKNKFIICFDIDNTICFTNKAKEYEKSRKNVKAIKVVNDLYDNGYYIKLYTARGMDRFNSDLNKIHKVFYNFTSVQLKNWGVRYHELILGKISYNLFIDDKSYGFNKNWIEVLRKKFLG